MKCLTTFAFLISSVLLTNATKTPSIVIIGAGTSGLSAGKKLLENGIQNITILEAESRIGGRINSVYFGENYVDLGATNCHGEKGNIVYETVKDLNLLGDTQYPKDFYYSSGVKVDSKFSEELIKIMTSIYPNMVEPAKNMSLGDYVIKYYNKAINEKFGSDKEKLNIAKGAIYFLETVALSDENSPSWFDITIDNDFIPNEGNTWLNWKGKGYKTFLEVFLNNSGVHEKVIFNKEVKKVSYDASKKWQGVTVSCSDNTQYVADHVIVTTSLGVLKENLNNLFEPELPSVKRKAIDRMGFGVIMTVALHYENPWWENDSKGFNFIWSKEDLENSVSEFSEGPHYNNRSWITYICGFVKADLNPNVLIAWFSGNLVPEIELISDETLSDGLTYLNKKFLGHAYNVTKPDKIIHSKWRANPHFRGSYSFQKPEAEKRDNPTNAEEDLAVPIKNVDGRPFVHFAGEATHAYYFSTVQGATESGLREAGIIKKYYS
ncbi:unnamed protein product [Psylliodes chrysocephalus]|uniref:Amine oxidase domain-containing protein n=1 Tax=Psylliodes chrysocephalus TaxID=3402493 RepID=A0A9P0D8A2_9CUCU|nr:unnamed protein product [Psylliodes chrysocephala]